MGATDTVDFLFVTSSTSFYLEYGKWIGKGQSRKFRARERKRGGGKFRYNDVVLV